MHDIAIETIPVRKLIRIRLRNGNRPSETMVSDFTRLATSWLHEHEGYVTSHVDLQVEDWALPAVLDVFLPPFFHSAEDSGKPIKTVAFTRLPNGEMVLNRLNHRRAPGKHHKTCKLKIGQVKKWLREDVIEDDGLLKHIRKAGVRFDHDLLVPVLPQPATTFTPQLRQLFKLGILRASAPHSNVETVALVPWTTMTVLKLLARR
jgi:hypothetical protein